MKRSVFLLAIIPAAIIVGCQDSNVNGPATAPVIQTGSLSKAVLSNRSNIIILQATVIDAGTGDQYSVTGQVKYGLTQLPIMREELFDIALDIQAKVKPLSSSTNGWTVNNTSSGRVTLTRQTSVTIDKWYFLRGGPNSRSLHIRFAVTATTVSVSSINIE